MNSLKYSFLIISIFILPFNGSGQASDSLKQKKKWHQTSLFRASIVPAVLIGYGLSTMQNHGLYSSYDAQRDIQRNFSGFNTEIDDYLIFAPYVELVALNLLKYKCKNDFINTSLLILKSELLMVAFVFPLKKITHIERPNKSGFDSFPSGHTAEAFVAASIIHKEYKHKSHWPGIFAYTVATSVGVFRMLNNAHWQADVFAGAGFGMLAVHLVYLTHKHRYHWKLGKKSCLLPTYYKGNLGFRFAASF
jgi:membrane-associated phospholipid phosphatase